MAYPQSYPAMPANRPLSPSEAAGLNRALADLQAILNLNVVWPLHLTRNAGSMTLSTRQEDPGITVMDTQWCTTLAVDITEAASAVAVNDYALFPTVNGFKVLIDDEVMTVTSGAGTATWGVTRAVNGTVAAPHLTYTPVCLQEAVASTLDSAIASDAVTLTVDGLAQFPTGSRFYVKIEDEILLVTGGAGTLTWTILRGQLETTAVSHAGGTPVVWIQPTVVRDVQELVFDGSARVEPSLLNPNRAIHYEVSQFLEIVGPPTDDIPYYDAWKLKRNAVTREWEREKQVWVLDADL